MTALFWKATAGILIAVVLVLTLGKQEKDLSLLLGMAGCVLSVIAAFSIWEPVLDFLYRLAELGDLPSDMLRILLKVTGIAVVSELGQMICNDSGNSSLAHGMRLLGAATVLLLSLPVLEKLLELVQQILGEL